MIQTTPTEKIQAINKYSFKNFPPEVCQLTSLFQKHLAYPSNRINFEGKSLSEFAAKKLNIPEMRCRRIIRMCLDIGIIRNDLVKRSGFYFNPIFCKPSLNISEKTYGFFRNSEMTIHAERLFEKSVENPGKEILYSLRKPKAPIMKLNTGFLSAKP